MRALWNDASRRGSATVLWSGLLCLEEGEGDVWAVGGADSEENGYNDTTVGLQHIERHEYGTAAAHDQSPPRLWGDASPQTPPPPTPLPIMAPPAPTRGGPPRQTLAPSTPLPDTRPPHARRTATTTLDTPPRTAQPTHTPPTVRTGPRSPPPSPPSERPPWSEFFDEPVAMDADGHVEDGSTPAQREAAAMDLLQAARSYREARAERQLEEEEQYHAA